jgi:hypothetical protein
MNFSFVPYFDPNQEKEFLYFQGYQLTDFTAYTLALCNFITDKSALSSNNRLQDMLEMIKHIHLYHQDWLKGSKTNIKQLDSLICDQIRSRYPHEIPPFVLFNTKSNGTIHILKKHSSYRIWLLRAQKLYCLDHTQLWGRWILRYYQRFSKELEPAFTGYSWRSKAKDVIFLQKEQRSLPKKKKNKKKLKTKLLSSDQSKLKTLDFFAQINLY